MAQPWSTSRHRRLMLLDELRTLFESKPTSLDQLREKLRARLVLAGGPSRLVNEAELIAEVLGDVEGVIGAQVNEWLDSAAASLASGYSKKQLQRFADEGTVETIGTHRNRRFRRGSLPIKPESRARSVEAGRAAQPALESTSSPRPPGPSPVRSSPPAIASVAGAPAAPVAARRGNPYDPTADAQRFARVGTSMRKNL